MMIFNSAKVVISSVAKEVVPDVAVRLRASVPLVWDHGR